jgi:hypothetical protein
MRVTRLRMRMMRLRVSSLLISADGLWCCGGIGVPFPPLSLYTKTDSFVGDRSVDALLCTCISDFISTCNASSGHDCTDTS